MPNERELSIEVRGMTCDHCERTVAKALESVPGVEEVLEVSHAGALARVTATPEATPARIESAVAKVGYRARVRAKQQAPSAPAVISQGGREFDLVIVGAGSAGFAAAIKAAELGARVAMAEGGTLGGTCVNVGCVPSKTLIRAAEAQHRRVHHGFQGIPTTDGRPDWSTVRSQKDALVAELRQAKYWNVLRSYEAVTLFEQRAEITSGHSVRLADGRTITAGKILVTTGASPWAAPIPGLAAGGYLDNVTAMALERLPESLIVIGASAVGLELAQLFARLGVKVTVLEALPRVVPVEDADVGNALGDYLRDEGLEVHAGVRIEQVGRLSTLSSCSSLPAAERIPRGSDSRRSVSRSDRRARSPSTSSSRRPILTSTPPATCWATRCSSTWPPPGGPWRRRTPSRATSVATISRRCRRSRSPIRRSRPSDSPRSKHAPPASSRSCRSSHWSTCRARSPRATRVGS